MDAYTEDELPLETLVCNCSQCNRLLLGESQRLGFLTKEEREKWPPRVSTRIDGRPWCHDCLMFKLGESVSGP